MVIEGEVDEEKSGRDCDVALTDSMKALEGNSCHFLKICEKIGQNNFGLLSLIERKLENLNTKNLRPFLKNSLRNKDKKKGIFPDTLSHGHGCHFLGTVRVCYTS